jgi:uncharacterized protein (DUF1800 family)
MRKLSTTILTTLLLLAASTLHAIPTDDARHLLARTGFGAAPAEIDALSNRTYRAAVDKLIAEATAQAAKGPNTPPPNWINQKPPARGKLSAEQRKQRNKLWRQQGYELKAWWAEEMVRTDTPLLEHMTLFWHNHFTSSLQKVKWTPAMWRQNQLLRHHALGSFRDLLHQIARDPAMLIYLDGVKNRKGKPNENFARELLELFTLGEGNYSETDIKEAARAFTGWSIDRTTGKFIFRKRLHDGGQKRFMGRSGRFNGDDIIDILLQQPRTAEFITEKAWREFISPQPNPSRVREIARAYRNSDYNSGVLMRQLLLSPEFRSSAIRGHLTKSPLDILVGSVRTLDIPLQDYRIIALASWRLGQNLFDPPNVKGWPGGDYWIDSAKLAARRTVLDRLLRGGKMAMGKKMGGDMVLPHPDLSQFTALAAQGDVGMERLINLLLALPPVEMPERQSKPQERLTQLIMDPAYQVK